MQSCKESHRQLLHITLDSAFEEEILYADGLVLPETEDEFGELLNLPDVNGCEKRNFIATLL